MCRIKAAVKFALSSSLLLIMLSGCGGSPDAFTGSRGHVSGKFTIDGTPAPQGCQVMFVALKGSYVATGITSDGGKYTLKYQVSSGMPAVEYEVQLTPPAVNAAKGAADPTAAGAAKVDKKQPVPDDGPVPAKYGSVTTSNLKFTVKSGANVADFDLTRKPVSK